MGEVGILDENDRVELIDGEIINVTPIGNLHAATVDRLNRLLIKIFDADGCVVRTQGPIEIDEHTEPEPDLALLTPEPNYYATRRPTPAEVLLLVEVSDTTLPFDQTVKLPLYAAAGVREYWIVDVNSKVLHVHREPADHEYAEVVTHRVGDTLAPIAFPDRPVALADFMV